MEKLNFKTFEKYFGSYDLKNELKSKIQENDFIVGFAYTDYGGDFFDKVAIEYFIENYPENTLWENTVYYGKNCFIFGEVAKEFFQQSENYLLGFENLEDFYSKMEFETMEKDFSYFLNDIKENYVFDFSEALEYLLQEKSGYYNITPQGLDFSWDNLIKELLKNKVILTKEYSKSLLYLFEKNNYEKSIAEYYVTTYENGNIKILSLDEKTLSIIQEFENQVVEA